MKPLCIDLFCGYGGWARGFLDAGYRVIGIDNEPKCAKRYPGEFVLADVRDIDGARFRRATVIVASPPCTEFTLMNRLRTKNPYQNYVADPWGPKGMGLVKETMRVIAEAHPDWNNWVSPQKQKSSMPYWCIENVRGAVPYIETSLGRPRAINGPQVLWGGFPGFISSKGRKPVRYSKNGKMWMKGDARTRAIIPYPLARALAEACKP